MNQLEVETKFSAISFMSLQCKLLNILSYPHCSCQQIFFLFNYWWAKKISSLNSICILELVTSVVCKKKCFNSAFSISVKMWPSSSINRSIISEFILLLLCLNHFSFLTVSQGVFIFNISNILFSFLYLQEHVSIAPFFLISCLHFAFEPTKLLTKVVFFLNLFWVCVMLFKIFKYSINLKHREI